MLARRGFDASLIAFGIAMLAIGNTLGKWVFVFFALLGANLVLGRHRTLRYLDPAFTLAVAAYFAWTAALVLWRGEPLAGNRFIAYAGIILAAGVLAPSFALVRRPLTALVAGARAGVLAVMALGAVYFIFVGGRIGLGFNEALFAFLIAGVGVAARIEVDDPPPYLPNGRWWTYVSLLPVLASGTRAAWFVYVLVALFDLSALFFRSRSGERFSPVRTVIAAIVVGGVGLWLAPQVMSRIEAATVEIQRLAETGEAVGSSDVRIVMWRAAYELVGEHPLVGVGATQRMEAVMATVAPQNAAYVGTYTHLHNFIADEAVSNGLVGLVLLIAIPGVFLVRVFQSGQGGRVRSTSVAFVFLLFTFGSFHGVFLNERTLFLTFAFMTLVLTHLRREALGGSFRPPKARPGAPALR